MASRLNPYIGFRDDARQAFEFYQSVFGGDLNLNTFGQFGQPDAPRADKIMHASLQTPNGFTLMGADSPDESADAMGSSISISLSGDDADDLRRWFDQLAEGGSVRMPLEKQMWGDEFGMLVDRFNVSWMVNIEGTDS